MTDALLLLLDRAAHPDALEATALAAQQLKGVTAVLRLPQGATVDVEGERLIWNLALQRMEADCRAAQMTPVPLAAEVYDDDGA